MAGAVVGSSGRLSPLAWPPLFPSASVLYLSCMTTNRRSYPLHSANSSPVSSAVQSGS